MSRAIYTYRTEKGKNYVHIIDLYDSSNPTMTVSNDAETVITEVLQKENWINADTKFVYTDSYGQDDLIFPSIDWDKRECHYVEFKPMWYNNY